MALLCWRVRYTITSRMRRDLAIARALPLPARSRAIDNDFATVEPAHPAKIASAMKKFPAARRQENSHERPGGLPAAAGSSVMKEYFEYFELEN